jgi:predicted 2-oxoglutarate/Fe(II)-dependent dioxygenase YbiX
MIEEIIFTQEECDWILSQTGEYTRGHVTYDGISMEESEMRTCYEYTFVDNQDINNLLFSKLEKFGVKSIPSEVTVVRYEVGQYFTNHKDRGIGHEDRIKTVSIQLSDTTDYSGGEFILWIWDDYTQSDMMTLVNKDLGNLVIFESDVSHYVTEVVNGTRYALVFWLKEENLI